jgi:hypothetical protein
VQNDKHQEAQHEEAGSLPDPAETRLFVEPRPRGRRRRRWVLPVAVAGAVIVLLVIAAFIAAHYTSRSSFCNTCHEMEAYYATWQHSAHASPVAECRQCHIPPGAISYIETKLFSFREIWVHFFGNPVPPLAVTRKIPNANCLACHTLPRDGRLGNVSFSHENKHAGLQCISCHVRLVHRTVNPPYYADPAAMSSCLKCHNGSSAPSQCSYCHTPPHEARGECDSCHSTTSWGSAESNHPFPLTGAHADLRCVDCHVSKPGVANIPGTTLARAEPACVSCHGDHHNGLTDCDRCHTPLGWTPAKFNHVRVGEHIPSGEKPLACSSCHPSGFAKASCTPCHSRTPGGD